MRPQIMRGLRSRFVISDVSICSQEGLGGRAGMGLYRITIGRRFTELAIKSGEKALCVDLTGPEGYC